MVVAMVVTMVVTIWLWKTAKKEKQMKYSGRGRRRRRNTDQWELRLLHKDPLTDEQVTTYHTITAKMPKQAEKAADEMIISMETNGYALYTSITVAEFMEAFWPTRRPARRSSPPPSRAIANGIDVRTAASYLGHSSVSMTLDIYADVDPEAKFSTVNKIESAFDDTMSRAIREDTSRRSAQNLNMPAEAIPFTTDQLKATLAIVENTDSATRY